MKLFFCLQINSKVFYKLSVSLWVCVTAHAQRPKITSFLFFCNILRKKEVSDEVEFLHTDKHNSLVQIDDMVFDRDGKALHMIQHLRVKFNLSYSLLSVLQLVFISNDIMIEISRKYMFLLIFVLFVFKKNIKFLLIFIHCCRKSLKLSKFSLPHHWCCELRLESSFK